MVLQGEVKDTEMVAIFWTAFKNCTVMKVQDIKPFTALNRRKGGEKRIEIDATGWATWREKGKKPEQFQAKIMAVSECRTWLEKVAVTTNGLLCQKKAPDVVGSRLNKKKECAKGKRAENAALKRSEKEQLKPYVTLLADGTPKVNVDLTGSSSKTASKKNEVAADTVSVPKRKGKPSNVNLKFGRNKVAPASTQSTDTVLAEKTVNVHKKISGEKKAAAPPSTPSDSDSDGGTSSDSDSENAPPVKEKSLKKPGNKFKAARPLELSLTPMLSSDSEGSSANPDTEDEESGDGKVTVVSGKKGSSCRGACEECCFRTPFPQLSLEFLGQLRSLMSWFDENESACSSRPVTESRRFKKEDDWAWPELNKVELRKGKGVWIRREDLRECKLTAARHKVRPHNVLFKELTKVLLNDPSLERHTGSMIPQAVFHAMRSYVNKKYKLSPNKYSRSYYRKVVNNHRYWTSGGTASAAKQHQQENVKAQDMTSEENVNGAVSNDVSVTPKLPSKKRGNSRNVIESISSKKSKSDATNSQSDSTPLNHVNAPPSPEQVQCHSISENSTGPGMNQSIPLSAPDLLAGKSLNINPNENTSSIDNIGTTVTTQISPTVSHSTQVSHSQPNSPATFHANNIYHQLMPPQTFPQSSEQYRLCDFLSAHSVQYRAEHTTLSPTAQVPPFYYGGHQAHPTQSSHLPPQNAHHQAHYNIPHQHQPPAGTNSTAIGSN